MSSRLKRCYGQGHFHFITSSCYRRLPLLGDPHTRDVFVKTLDEVRRRYRFKLAGYVVMPEHFHLLIGEAQKHTPSIILQSLKQRVPRALQRESQAGVIGQSIEFWMPRFYDFNVWSQEKISEKLEYMHNNPVKRGLVSHPKDWVWSSYSFYDLRGTHLIPIDPP